MLLMEWWQEYSLNDMERTGTLLPSIPRACQMLNGTMRYMTRLVNESSRVSSGGGSNPTRRVMSRVHRLDNPPVSRVKRPVSTHGFTRLGSPYPIRKVASTYRV